MQDLDVECWKVDWACQYKLPDNFLLQDGQDVPEPTARSRSRTPPRHSLNQMLPAAERALGEDGATTQMFDRL
eukprot:12970581-Alexandrium_andersonii.AAC.1